jgi:hypothetical protein
MVFHSSAVSDELDTIITCAPFTVNTLLGDNILFREPPPQDRRSMVKYTSLSGAPHEFRCRTWVVSFILSDGTLAYLTPPLRVCSISEYKLVDANFCEMDRTRWITLTTVDEERLGSVYLRLLKEPQGDIFNVSYSERLLASDRTLVLQLATFQVMMEHNQKALTEACRSRRPSKKISDLERSIRSLRSEQRVTRRRRVGQRFLLMAARYHLIDPRGVLWEDDQVYHEAIRNRKPFKRTSTTFSGTGDPRNQDLQLSLFNSSGGTTHARPDGSKFERRYSKTLTTPGKIDELPSAADKLGQRDAAVVKQVIDRLRLPPRRPPPISPNLLARATGDDRVSDDTFEEINALFYPPPPRRAKTSQSLILADPQLPSIWRTRTLDVDIDLEAQTMPGRKKRAVTFVEEARDRIIIPTFTIQADNTTSAKRHHPTSIKIPPRKSPFNARDVKWLEEGRKGGSLAITPQRVPRVRDLSNHPIFKIPITKPTGDQTQSTLSRGPVNSRLETNRKEKDMKRLQPFFEWKTTPTTPSTPRSSEHNHTRFDSLEENGSMFPLWDGSGSTVTVTLDILDSLMTDSYQPSEDFAIQPRHYIEVRERTLPEVIELLEKQASSLGPCPDPKHPSADQMFWETKVSILLKVDTILSCFIGNNEAPNKVVKKIWGIVYDIIAVTLEEVSKIPKRLPVILIFVGQGKSARFPIFRPPTH